MGIGFSFPGGKAPGRGADHSLPSNAEVKNGEVVLELPLLFISTTGITTFVTTDAFSALV
jgi:hypothetical protein